ncbi:MAG TPA: acetate--CoA ligase family protein, partial [Eoetvoesiella sp.]
AGAKAAVSHTGALAGADSMYDALFTQTGVIRAQKFSDLLDIPVALSTGRVLHGKRVAILTSTGGAGTLVSDSLGVCGFETPSPDPQTAQRLRALQSGDHAALDRNPIDVTLAGLQPDLLRGAIRAVLDSPSYDALAIIVGSSSLAAPGLMADAINDCLPLTDKPVLAYVSPHAPHVAALLNQRGVPAYTEPESCTVALEGMLQVARLNRPSALPTSIKPVSTSDLPAGALDEAQAKELFTRFGVPGVREIVICAPEQALEAARTLGSRVVLKILEKNIAHKSDIGGVAVNIMPEQASARLTEMKSRVKAKTGISINRFLVQEMVSGGVELILGFHRDPLGSAILLGMGGITAELLNDTSMRLLPSHGGLSREEAMELMQELKTWPLLNGFRGTPKADVEALAAAIVSFSRMADQMGERLIEAEINPLFVLPCGEGVKAADGIAILSA